MAILLSNEQNEPVDEGLIERIAEHVLRAEGVPSEAELSIALVGKMEIGRLNEEYRGVAGPTDVLSFPMEDAIGEEPVLVGDVVISPAVARVNAEEYGHSLDAEIGLLLVHGILHLLGYEHDEDERAAVMETRERELLKPFFQGVFEG